MVPQPTVPTLGTERKQMRETRQRIPFEEWMRLVNQQLLAQCGMDSDMLPDYCYYDAWKDRQGVHETVAKALCYARDF